jgi:hypothetical protein
LLQNNAN